MQKLRVGSLLGSVTVLLFLFSFSVASATSTVSSSEEERELFLRATVASVVKSSEKNVPNTPTYATYTTFSVTFLEGEMEGKRVEIEDSTFPVKTGDTVYVRYTKTKDGGEYFSIFEVDRSKGLLVLFAIFFVAVLLIGRKQGFLSLLALFVSFGFIFKLLFPSILSGGNIVLVSTIGALLSLFVVMFLTHGFSRLTISAYLGCTLSVLVTLFLALYATSLTKLTGFATEESVFLNLATQGGLDFVALLVGGIIIGVIGVIDDVSITQASVVGELKSAGEHLSRKELYVRAMKVGRDHMGAVINTLILAYTGAALPLVLFLYISDTPTRLLINSEVVTTEIVRTLVGSMGLLAAVPLTTLIAVFIMKKESTPVHHAHRH